MAEAGLIYLGQNINILYKGGNETLKITQHDTENFCAQDCLTKSSASTATEVFASGGMGMIPGKNMPDGFQRLAFNIIVID